VVGLYASLALAAPHYDFEFFSDFGFRISDLFTVPNTRLDFQRILRQVVPQRGRTGFDLVGTPEAACRGWFVGLVNHRTKTIIANEELALAA
jgi:hypothetical protein